MKLSEISKEDELVFNGQNYNAHCLTIGKTYRVLRIAIKGFVVACNQDQEHFIHWDNLSSFHRFIQQRGGWIGVDLDGTLAIYDKWRGPDHIGEPIMPMVMRVRQWIQEGRNVKIFTARVTEQKENRDGTPQVLEQRIAVIQAWCLKHLGATLPITNVKDWDMMELWDDRCVQVVPNTGKTIKEHHNVSE